MMSEGLKKFKKLLLQDTDFRRKLEAAEASYTGEQTEEAVFDGVFVPIAQEYGISVTFEEYKAYFEKPDGQEMEMDDLLQVAGGKGIVVNACAGIGIHANGISKNQTVCANSGFGNSEGAYAGLGI